MEQRLNKSVNKAYCVKLHIVLVCKYRSDCITGDLKANIEKYMVKAAMMVGVKIEEINTDINHLHMLIDIPLNKSISRIVGGLKQYSQFLAWQEHEEHLKKFFWKKKVLWNRGGCITSVGYIDTQKVTEYIRNQGK